jgi:hypothetical protein
MSGSLSAGQSTTVQTVLNRSQRSGQTTLVFSVVNDTQQRTVSLSFDEAVTHKRPDISYAFVVGIIKDGDDLAVAHFQGAKADDDSELAVVQTSKDDGFAYKLQPLDPREYLIVGLTDDNGDQEWQDGEGVGIYPDLSEPRFVALEEDQKMEGVNFVIRPTFLGNGSRCPDNSYQDGSECICSDGHVVSGDGQSCVPG